MSQAEAEEVRTDEEIVLDAIEARNQADEAEASSGSPYRWRQADAYLELSDRGWPVRKIASRCDVSSSLVGFYVKCARVYPGRHERPYFQLAYREAQGAPHVSHNSGDNEWYTPEEYILAARATMLSIDLDPASSAEANALVLATHFFSVEDDGLSRDWAGRVWMNPPYAQPLIDQFCAKLAAEYVDGEVTEACALVNNATETAWFAALAEVAGAICFPRGRVKFWHPDKTVSAPLQGQAILYLGKNSPGFRHHFREFGFTVLIP